MQHRTAGDRFLVATACQALRLVQYIFYHLHIRQHQLGFDGPDIAQRIDRTFNVDDVRVFKAADHMKDGIHLSDVGQELVAKAFALAGSADDPRNVHQADDGRQDLLALNVVAQNPEPLVRHGDHSDVRFDGAERIVRGLDSCRREGVEKRALSDIR